MLMNSGYNDDGEEIPISLQRIEIFGRIQLDELDLPYPMEHIIPY